MEDSANGHNVNQQEDEDSPEENLEQDVLYPEKFVVVGSWQEENTMCSCHMHVLMVFHIEKWQIIGYQQYLHKLCI